MTPGPFRQYRAVFSARFRTLLQYRAAAIAGFGTQLFWGLIRVMIFEAFYLASTAPQPMALSDVVTYVWLGQATLALTLGGVDQELQQMVRGGTVAYELLRPVDLYAFWYSRSLANRLTPMLLRAVPMFVLAGFFLGLGAPASPAAAAGWITATAAAALLAAALWTVMSISLLWTLAGDGVSRFLPAVIYLGSGMAVPLPLLPAWLRPWVEALPFRGLADTPFRLYTGHLPPDQLPGVLLHQLAWTAALALLGRWLLAVAQRRLVVQGG